MENIYDKTERYLLGELSGEELAAFENALRDDPGLAKSVAQHREMIHRLDALRLRNKVKVASSGRSRPGGFAYRSGWVLLMVAAMVLIPVIWYYQVSSKTSESLESPAKTINPPAPAPDSAPVPVETPVAGLPKKPVDNSQLIAMARAFQEQPSNTFVRDAGGEAETTEPKTRTQQAAEAFYRQDFKAAADLLRADSEVVQDEAARYIRANARFKLGQYATAGLDFEALKTSFQFKHEARFNLLLCQIALGKTDGAKKMLSDMSNEPAYPFRAKALELKHKLNW